jgi:hypothetical protein
LTTKPMNTAQTLRRARRLATCWPCWAGQVWAQQSAIYLHRRPGPAHHLRPPHCRLHRPAAARELSNSGATLRVIPPTPTAAERDAQRAHEREAALARQRARDAIRRDQVLLTRYPDAATHDLERKRPWPRPRP